MNLPEIKKIIEEKVIGIYVPEHSALGHQYRNTKTNKLVTSVTTKLQAISRPHLIPWSVKMGALWLMEGDRAQKLLNPNSTEAMIQGMQMASTDIRDTAGSTGTIAHNIIERYINLWITGNQPEDIKDLVDITKDNPASIASARAVQVMFKKHNVVPIASELLVGNDNYSAGTLDFLCLWDGKLAVLDWKTSNSVDKNSYSLQVAAYVKFFEEMTGLKIKEAKIVHLSKDYDKFELYNVKNIVQIYSVFKAVCKLYDFMYSKKDKLVKDIKRISI